MSALLYELWDYRTGNCIGAYEDQESALADVRDTVNRYDAAAAATLVLLTAPDDEEGERIAAGEDLIRLAVATGPRFSYLGIGLYSFPEAAHIIRAKPSDLRRWLHRDSYQVRGKKYRRVPFVTRSLPDEPNIVTFHELIELWVIKQFRDKGVPMQEIRRTARRYARDLNTEFPFSTVRFKTDRRYLYPEAGTALQVGSQGQLGIADVLEPFLENIDYTEEGFASQYWPRTRRGRVVLDPKRQFGHPIDAQTGMPTRVLYLAVKANPDDGYEAVAHWYNVPPAAVVSAFEYENSLMAA